MKTCDAGTRRGESCDYIAYGQDKFCDFHKRTHEGYVTGYYVRSEFRGEPSYAISVTRTKAPVVELTPSRDRWIVFITKRN